MIVTFARRVSPQADLDAEEAALVHTVEGWLFLAYSEDGEKPLPPITTRWSDTYAFEYAADGGMRMDGLVMVTDYGIRHEILIEAKVEVPE